MSGVAASRAEGGVYGPEAVGGPPLRIEGEAGRRARSLRMFEGHRAKQCRCLACATLRGMPDTFVKRKSRQRSQWPIDAIFYVIPLLLNWTCPVFRVVFRVRIFSRQIQPNKLAQRLYKRQEAISKPFLRRRSDIRMTSGLFHSSRAVNKDFNELAFVA